MIKAVLFDIDGVLLDSFAANLKFFQDLIVKAGYPAPTRETYREAFHLPFVDAIRFLVKSGSETELQRILEMGKKRDVPYDLALLRLPDDVEKVLKTLSQKYRLGIVTSRRRATTFEAPQLVKFKKYFETSVSYEDTERHKPFPDPLLLAAKILEIRPDACVYVGDAKSDVEAARAAGMKGLLYSKDSISEADGCTAVFNEFPTLIARL